MMISGYNKAILYDLKGKRNIEAEVNFSDNTDLKDTVRIKMGSEEAIIPIKELFSFTFAVANNDQQADLVPVTQTEVVKYRKWHIVEAKSDIRQGQKIRVRCEVNVPLTVVNGLNGSIGKLSVAKNSSPILI